jgi:hypothetical protein
LYAQHHTLLANPVPQRLDHMASILTDRKDPSTALHLRWHTLLGEESPKIFIGEAVESWANKVSTGREVAYHLANRVDIGKVAPSLARNAQLDTWTIRFLQKNRFGIRIPRRLNLLSHFVPAAATYPRLSALDTPR